MCKEVIVKKVLVTGSSGFVGSELVTRLKQVSSLVTLQTVKTSKGDTQIALDFTQPFQLTAALTEVDTIIHCAARVHVMNDDVADPLAAFRLVNTQGTLRLAKQAAEAGVRRFIFISSIKVNGESTKIGQPFTPYDTYIPDDPYGLSKYEAEVGLRKIAEQSAMEVVIIRPTLVYGPGVKGNFMSMMKWMNKGLPLPLGGLHKNKRSLVSVSNLVDLVVTCIKHPNAGNQTFLVSDDNDLSTTQLLSDIAKALKAPNRLLPIPSSWLKGAAILINKPAIAQRLCGSLQVDISNTKELLNWAPPDSQAVCLERTVHHFLVNNYKK